MCPEWRIEPRSFAPDPPPPFFRSRYLCTLLETKAQVSKHKWIPCGITPCLFNAIIIHTWQHTARATGVVGMDGMRTHSSVRMSSFDPQFPKVLLTLLGGFYVIHLGVLLQMRPIPPPQYTGQHSLAVQGSTACSSLCESCSLHSLNLGNQNLRILPQSIISFSPFFPSQSPCTHTHRVFNTQIPISLQK